MTKTNLLASDIRAYCAAHADAKQAARCTRYFKEGYDAWGLLDKNNPLWNEKQKEWLEKYSGMGLGGFLKLGDALFASGKYKEGALAIRFVAEYLKRHSPP
jgi:hypothetical protein